MRRATTARRGKATSKVRKSAPKARRTVKAVRRATARKHVRTATVKSLCRYFRLGHTRVVIATGAASIALVIVFAGMAGWFVPANAVPKSNQRDVTIDAIFDSEVTRGRSARVAPANSPATNPASVTTPPVVIPAVKPASVGRGKPGQARAVTRLHAKTIRSPRRHVASAAVDSNESFGSSFGSSTLVDEARRYLGGNPTGRSSLWCGAFMDLVLKRTGHRGGGNLARGYLNYGERVSTPQVGAIVVLGRQGGGHVGVVSGIDANGNPIVISGNHNRRVAEATYPRSRVIGYVIPR